MDKKINKLIISLLVAILCIACVQDPAAPAEKTAADYTNLGWQNFEADEFNDALNNFNFAIDLDNNYTEAYVGKGWTYMLIDSLPNALNAFDIIPPQDLTNDAIAALAFIDNAIANYQDSNELIDSLKSGDANWTFTHRGSVDITLINLLQAHNYISIGDYAHALTAFQLVEINFQADINSDEGKNALLTAIESHNPGISEIQAQKLN